VAVVTCSPSATLSTGARRATRSIKPQALPLFAGDADVLIGRRQSRPFGRSAGTARKQESQMPKLKTKSGAKKRFKVTGTGKVLFAQSGKRHGMIKRTNKQIRDHRGTAVMFKTDGDRIRQYWLPND
jgi:large subunit ribosomal protein L35